jgi:hypothetical protein
MFSQISLPGFFDKKSNGTIIQATMPEITSINKMQRYRKKDTKGLNSPTPTESRLSSVYRYA